MLNFTVRYNNSSQLDIELNENLFCKLIIVKSKIRKIYNQISDVLNVYFINSSISPEKLDIISQLFCNMHMLFIPVPDKITN